MPLLHFHLEQVEGKEGMSVVMWQGWDLDGAEGRQQMSGGSRAYPSSTHVHPHPSHPIPLSHPCCTCTACTGSDSSHIVWSRMCYFSLKQWSGGKPSNWSEGTATKFSSRITLFPRVKLEHSMLDVQSLHKVKKINKHQQKEIKQNFNKHRPAGVPLKLKYK